MDSANTRSKVLRQIQQKVIADNLSSRPIERLDQKGKYRIIYADPPWKFENVTTPSRQVENHYSTMNLEEIKNLKINEISEDDCVIFLWSPNSKNGEAHQVLNAWGFTYKTNFVWVKENIGLGHYNRQRHELLLIGTKGNIGAPDDGNRFDSVIEAPRGKHSEKPEIVYDMIEQMYPNSSKIELFARKSWPGWDKWGYEAPQETR